MVDQLLRKAGCSLADLDAIAFGRGPGSFTGLRICLGVVQGLAFGARLPVIPVSTLAAMALAHQRSGALESALPCLVALDARMEEVYWALYGTPPKGTSPCLLNKEQVMAPGSVAGDAQVVALNGQFVALGSGWHYQDLAAIRPAVCLQSVYPQAEHVALIAVESWSRGEYQTVMDAEPVYLRDQVSWQKRQRIRVEAPAPISSKPS
jgi:tRNA threonylcarbamoyladenosine biosynthesis protein TsaB